MLVKAYAKLNLYLCVGDKHTNGFHEITSLFQNIDLFDVIELNKCSGSIKYKGPQLENNILFKVLKTLKINKGLSITLNKRIPQMAGLGGGSSDAAAFIVALNELFGLGLSKDDMIEIAFNMGSDVPFFLYGGTCLITGFGERITKMESLNGVKVFLFLPNHAISTKDAYFEFDKNPLKCKGDLFKLYELLHNKQFDKIDRFAFNSFDILFDKEQWVIEAKNLLKSMGGINPMLTGSGSCIFAYSNDQNKISLNTNLFVANFIDRGYDICSH